MTNIMTKEETVLNKQINNDSLNKLFEYYSIKRLYEEEYQLIKLNLIKNNNLSWKEKRIELTKKLVKCVNCKRNVGTIFSKTLNNEGDDRFLELRAKCGDRKDPCPLNIEIDIDRLTHFIPDTIHEMSIELNKLKNDIIKYKNNVIFGYINVNNEEIYKLKTDLKWTNDYLNFITNKMNNIDRNFEKEEKLNELYKQFYTQINSIKEWMKEYELNNDNKYILDSVEIYINGIEPLLKEIRNIKYKHMNVEIIDNKFHLIQKKYDEDDLEEKLDNYINVKSFIVGMGKNVKKNDTKKVNRTKKNDENKKTRKNKISVNFNIDEEKEME